MKKIFKISGIILIILIITLIAAPFLFRDKIEGIVRKQIDESLNAQVYFADVGLSFIRNFPNARISIRDFGVVGVDTFLSDTLIHGKNFDLVVDIMSVVAGDEINLKKIILDEAKIKALVLKDGTANWDIMKEDSAAVEETQAEETSNLVIKLEEYRLNNSSIIYDDATFPMRAELTGLNHSGKGDFTLEIYELSTLTQAEKLTVVYDGIEYLKNAKAEAQADMKVVYSATEFKIDFLDNLFTVNELPLNLDGWVSMPTDDIDMDLRFKTPSTSFRSILSLVPGVYSESFKDLKTDGQLAFDGFAKGIYNDTQMPGFGLNLKVTDAMMQYPDLPQPVTGINMDVSVLNPDGDLEKTSVDIRTLHADFGKNPLDATAKISGLEKIKINGSLKADLNLDELTRIFPIEGTTLKGKFTIDAEANGVYDETQGVFPKVDAVMAMTEGYVKNAEYPAELTEMNFHASLNDPDGSMANAVLDVPEFRFKLDGEPITGKANVRNFDDPNYLVEASGKLDLEKLMQIYPIDSMTLSGKLIVDHFSTKGKYSDIEAENYTNLPTSGTVQVQNLVYTDYYLPKPVTIETGTATFTPSKLEITGAKGNLGSSDYALDGYFSNYMAYALMDNQMLKGNMRLVSNRMDLNEWMVEEESTPTTTGTEETEMEVIPVPDNLDIVFDADMKEVIYDDLSLKNIKGRLTVANEEVAMENLGFGMFGSQVAMNGIYNTANLENPTYNFYLDIKNLGIKDAFTHFTTVQGFAPILKFVEGVCNTEFGISGRLKQNMMPVLEEVNSLGLFQIISGKLENSGTMNALAEKTNLQVLSKLDLKEVQGKFKIENGFLEISPIDLKVKDILFTIGGRQNLTGNLDYEVKIDAPPGAIGNAAFSALSNLSGGAVKASERVNVNLKLRGTVTEPKVSGAGGGTGDEVGEQLTELAEDKISEKLGTDVQLNKDSIKSQISDLKKEAKDSLKSVATKTAQQVKDSLLNAATSGKTKEELAKELKEGIGDGIKSQTGEDLKGTLNDLKDKFGFPKKKKND
ncbi:MAG: AsmA-like C-terminal region-containing protein [Bacteroidia bacterium]|nr:AsmA-like C-terminal region-containing protein [Bacteroidia bacterium]